MEVVDLEAVDLDGGATAAETQFIHQLVIVGMLRFEYNKVRREMRAGWRRETVDHGMMQYSVCAVLGVCSTRCMQYSVYAAPGVNS